MTSPECTVHLNLFYIITYSGHNLQSLLYFPSISDKNTPFSKWTKEQVCGWLEDYGLGHYVNLTRQWVESGQTLLSATPQDMEKVKHQNVH